MPRKGVFISYSKKDVRWLNQLKPHLSILEQDYELSIWDDSKITVGADWRDEIEEAMSSAKVAILMVSAHFLSSNFIKKEELPALLRAAEDEGAFIFPIIISPCMFSDIQSISRFQTFNPPTKPLIDMKTGDREALFHKVSVRIKEVLSSKEDVVIPQSAIPTIEKSSPPLSIDQFRISYTRVILLQVLDKYEADHLSITDLQKASKLDKRKDIVSTLNEMLELSIVNKISENKNVFFKLTNLGKDLVQSYKKIS